MSLQVWLPLTKNLTQQGLSNVSVINNGATYQSTGGKLGGAYNFGTGASSLSLPTSTFTSLSGDFSVACWVKILSWNSSYATFWSATSTSASWANVIAALCRNGSSSKLIFCLGNDSQSITSSCSTVDDIQLNTWYHFTCVYTAGKAHLYQNGILIRTVNVSFTPKTSAVKVVNIGKSRESTYQSNCLMNDFRIYNHALSAMEVKELSKGLMLHYPLSRNGWGQENIAINTGTRSPDQTSQVEWKGFKIGNLPITEGEQLTVSFDLEMKIGTAITNARPYLLVYNTNYRGQHGQWIYASNSSTYDMIPSGTYAVGDIIKRRVSFTINAASTFNPGTYSEDWIEFYSNYSTENEITIKNIKIERGDTATPWCPNSSDSSATIIGLDSTVEYDCSGFGNNGVLNGINEYTSDTIRYNVSRIFNGVNNPVTLPNLSTLISDGIFTFSVWFKKETDQWSSKSWETIFGGPSGFEFSSKSRSTNRPVLYAYSWNKGTYNYTLDEWHHFVMVRTTSGTIFYLDGVQAFTGTAGSIPSGNYFLGAWSTITGQNYKGKMSDARIYATALSADDIQSLYADKGYIDNKGNVYGTLYEI